MESKLNKTKQRKQLELSMGKHFIGLMCLLHTILLGLSYCLMFCMLINNSELFYFLIDFAQNMVMK